MREILPVLFFALLAAILVAAVALVFPAYKKSQTIKLRQEEVKSELKTQKSELLKLKRESNALENDPKAVERVAREKFNYCKDGELVYKFKEEAQPTR